MRMSARTFLLSTMVLFLTAGMIVPAASAGTVTVQFSGTVANKVVNFPANVLAGDTISSSSFTYTTTPASGNPTSGAYTFTGSSLGLALLVNTPVAVTQPGPPPVTYNAAVWGDNYKSGGTFSITLSKSGSLTTMKILMGTNGGTADGKTTGGSVLMTFTSSTYNSLVLPTTAAQWTSFATTKGTLVWDPPTGKSWESDDIGNLIINGQNAIPEPSSLVLGLGALATCAAGVMISRRKAARALGRSEIAPSSCD